jgi:hypothetical protein
MNDSSVKTQTLMINNIWYHNNRNHDLENF